MPEDDSTDQNHAHKKAKDAFGGDPLNPNDVLLHLIADAVISGKKDEVIERWAHAFVTICPDPVDNTPRVSVDDWHATPPGVRVLVGSPYLHRAKLSKAAHALLSGTGDEEAAAWAQSVKEGAQAKT